MSAFSVSMEWNFFCNFAKNILNRYEKNLFIILAFIPFVSFAQKVELDTLFYDKEWKGVESPQFASFYRIYNPDTTSSFRKSFRKIYRDFYITGELQSEGSYI